MANLLVLNGLKEEKRLKTDGEGTDLDPHIPHHVVDSITGALPAGTNNIGDVDVLTVPADPFGVNADAVVGAGAAGSIQAKLRRATQGLEDLKSLIVLAAGANRIGKVTVRNAADAADIDPVAEGTFTNRLGEVQASPTANTLLARIKDL